MTRMTRLRQALPLAALLAFAACEGPNLFSGPAVGARGGGQPPRVEIETPRGDSLTARPLGDSVLVRARVRDDLGIDSVRMLGVAFRGDPALGTQEIVVRYEPKTILLSGAVRDTVLSRFLIATPDTVREVVRIVVEAFDVEGLAASDTVRITVGGPSVDLLNLQDNQAVQAGLTLSLQMTAADPQGIIGAEFRISGAFADTIRRVFNPAVDSVRFDTAVVIPSGVTGDVQVLAVARNSLDIAGQDGPVRLRIVQAGATDVTPPSLSMTVSSPDRLEVQDSVHVRITGADDPQGSGVVRAGVTVTARAPGRGVSETRVFTRDFQPPRTGTITETLSFSPFNIDLRSLPDTLVFEITAFLVDDSGNCAAAVAQGQTQSLPCATAPDGAVTAENQASFRHTRMIVSGRTVVLPAGGRIMDAAVDVVRRNLLLSNLTRDRIEVFRLPTEQFAAFIPVGSEPWGITINRTGDTLLVANSGGTNVSSVYLGPSHGMGPAFEVPAARFLTPPVSVFNVQRTVDGTGFLRYTVFDACPVPPPATGTCFTGRPQFLVQDFTGRIVYSTKTTSIGAFGTMRKAFVPPGGQRPEVVLFWEHARLVAADDFTAVVNADRVLGHGSEVEVVDHIAGDTTMIRTGPVGDSLPLNAVQRAVTVAQGLGSDAVAVPEGRLTIQNLGFTDTTFVGISGDRRWAIVGEGTVEFGRVIMYDAARDVVSDVIQVADLMRNASERVRGIGLNQDGTLGVVRGFQAYFFSEDLRLQGVADLPLGGAGAVMHPLHANARSLGNPTGIYDPNTHVAFVGTGEGTIEIIDTFHFFRSGRIFIRDVPSGPLRAVLPFPEDNAGLQCQSTPVTDRFGNPVGQAVEIFAGGDFNSPHPPAGPTEDLCVVLKLFGVTDSGGVVIIDVRKADVLRSHPARN